MNKVPTAREQFVQDYLLVTDNNQDAYKMHMKIARESGGSVSKMSDKLQESYELAISQTVDNLRQMSVFARGYITADLISQLLLGWGSDVFDDIARHYIDLDLENRLVTHLTSVLKTEQGVK
jgi:hypothetical protein